MRMRDSDRDRERERDPSVDAAKHDYRLFTNYYCSFCINLCYALDIFVQFDAVFCPTTRLLIDFVFAATDAAATFCNFIFVLSSALARGGFSVFFFLSLWKIRLCTKCTMRMVSITFLCFLAPLRALISLLC